MWPPTTVHLACYHLAAEPESQGTLADTGPLVSEVTHAGGFCLKPWGPHQGLIRGKNASGGGSLSLRFSSVPGVNFTRVSAQRSTSAPRPGRLRSSWGGICTEERQAGQWYRDWVMLHKSVKECSLISSGTLLLRAAPFPLHPRAQPEWRDAATTAGFERETQVCRRDGLLRFLLAPEPESLRWTGASYNGRKHVEPLL